MAGGRGDRRGSPRGRGIAPSLVAALVVGAVSAIAWFRPGTHISTGDVGHFVRDRLWAELLPFYGYELTGAGSGTYEIARALELPFWGLGRLVGSEAVGQAAFYSVLAAATAAAGAHLATRLSTRRGPAVVAGIIAVCNPLTLTTFPNPNTLLATAVVATFAALLLGPVRRRWDGLLLALATLPASYLAVNPPTLVVLAGCAIVVAVVAMLHPDAPSGGVTARRLLRSVPWLVLFHAWWAVPQAIVLVAGAAPLDSGIASIDAWSWSHRNNSLGRVTTLQAHWGWHDASYFPYAPLLDRPWWSWTAYVLPSLAALGAVLAPARLRRAALALALASVLGIALAAGLHPPLTALNRWLHAVVPGWWLFREPMSKWGILVVIAYIPLVAVGLDRLADGGDRFRASAARRLARTGVVVAAVATVAYPWPLVTGHVVPVDRPTLPAARSAVPEQWRSVSADLNADPNSGKILLLPVPTFYQASTHWGFHGVPNVPLQMLTRPVVAPETGGYFSEADGTVSGLARTAQQAILAGDEHVARRALQSLGITDLVVRLDQQHGPAQPLSAEPQSLDAALAGADWVERTHHGPHAAVYAVQPGPGGSRHGRLTTAGVGVTAGAQWTEDLSGLVAHLPLETVLLSDVSTTSDAPLPLLDGAVIVPGVGPVHVDTPTPVTPVPAGPDIYRATFDGSRLTIGHAATLAGQPPDERTVALGGDLLGLDVGGEVVVVGREPVTFGASPTTPTGALVVAGRRPLALSDGEFGDCDNVDGRPLSDTDVSMAATLSGGVILHAAEHAACVMVDLPTVHDGDLIEVTVANRVGAPARACVHDDAAGACVAAASTHEDGRLLLHVDAVAPLTGGRLFLYADGQEQTTTITYTDASVTRPHRVPIELPGRAAGVEVHGEVAALFPVAPPRVGSASALQNCARTDQRSFDEVGLRMRTLPDRVTELAATEHAACVSFPVRGHVAGAMLEVAVPAVRVAGRAPRACLWADGPDTCIGEATLESDATGASELSIRARVPVAAHGLELFVYADGAGDRETIARYGVPRATVDPGVSWFTTPSTPSPPPEVLVRHHRPGRIVASLAAAEEPFILTLADGDGRNWDLDGIDGRVLATATVDGYATGWIVGPGPAATVVAEHILDRAVRQFHLAWAGLLLAALAAVLAAAVLGGRGWRSP